MKAGFAEKNGGVHKEDITRDRDSDPKGLLGGLAVGIAVLGGLMALSLKLAEKRENEK